MRLLPSVVICVAISVCYSAADSINNGKDALEEEVYTKKQFLELLKEQGLHLEKDKIFNDNDIEYSSKNGRMGSKSYQSYYKTEQTEKKSSGFFGFIEELISAVVGVISFVLVAIVCLIIGVIYMRSDKQDREGLLGCFGIFLLIGGAIGGTFSLFFGAVSSSSMSELELDILSWFLAGFILFIGCIFSCIFGGKKY